MTLRFKNLSSSRSALAQNLAEIVFLPFVFMRHCYCSYQDILTSFFLLDPQLLACTQIKLDPLTNLPDA